MSKQAKARTWGHIVLAMAGLGCVTALAVLRDISGDVALVAIVSILGAGGVNTALTVLSGGFPRPGNGEAGGPADDHPTGG